MIILNTSTMQNKMEETMKRIHNEAFDTWIQNFALNLENIWNESSTKELDSLA